ncbi:BTB/POZ and MATH domain-containing protein 1-like [Panicum virgatum]|uniref:BTB/POZ and MATH domain-containing protein 1-like n=1 Tax=Panicum virgatum TaxID=38727 RepID=UPI0019D58B0A|nr:BTB/POZ and MATH domain-containing protein 1-like [Panicum virgatum]
MVPCSFQEAGKGELYLSIFLRHESRSKDAKAIFEAFVMDRDGAPSSSYRSRFVHVFPPNASHGWPQFVQRSVLESLCLTDGSFIIMCGVKVVPEHDGQSSDIGSHPGHLDILLDSADGSDVSFIVDGEEFTAHRAVLAARSPVFKAQLLGSMADANMSSITLNDITPAMFKVMLRFIYTDDLLENEAEAQDEDEDEGEDEKDDYASKKLQDLLAAADHYALDRLKLLCASKLQKKISGDIVASTLACAQMYNCPELKKRCIDFFADEKNFKKAVLTHDFAQMVLQFPSILDELKVKVRV